MVEQNLPRKTLIFIIIGLCVGAGSLPSISGTPNSVASQNQNHIGLDVILHALMQRFPHAFPLLRSFMNC